MEKERAGRKAYDAKNAIEGLGEHALNFAANEAGSGEIEVGESEHVAFNAALLFLINGHDKKHGDEDGGDGGDWLNALAKRFRCIPEEVKSEESDAPKSEGHAGRQNGRQEFRGARLSRQKR